MTYVNMKPSEILSKEQIVALKEKKDWKNVVSIVSNWSQIVIAIALLYISTLGNFSNGSDCYWQ